MSERQNKRQRENERNFRTILDKNIYGVVHHYMLYHEKEFMEVVNQVYYEKYPWKKKSEKEEKHEK